jgi:hypothetical protein
VSPWEGVGEEPNLTTARKPDALKIKNYSVFSAHHHDILPTPLTNLAKHKTNLKQNETRFEAVESPNYS